MADPVTLPPFKPRKPGSHLFEWEQASLHAEQQFPKHPGVDRFIFTVDYSLGKMEEEFVKGEHVFSIPFDEVLRSWSDEVGATAEAEARKSRAAREGWIANEERNVS
jgi:hypothetical protein